MPLHAHRARGLAPSLLAAFAAALVLCPPLSALPTPGHDTPPEALGQVLVISDDPEVLDDMGAVAIAAVPGTLHLLPPPASPSSGVPAKKTDRNTDHRIPLALVGAGVAALAIDGAFEKDGMTKEARRRGVVIETVNSLGDTPVMLAAAGGLYLLDDKTTGKLALAALLNAALMTEATKRLAGRARPYVAGDAGEFTGITNNGDYKSFPSGHASATFALATVLADRHPKQKWLYYGLAAAVAAARIVKSAHFPSDVLVGAGIGIYAGRQTLRHGPRFLTITF